MDILVFLCVPFLLAVIIGIVGGLAFERWSTALLWVSCPVFAALATWMTRDVWLAFAAGAVQGSLIWLIVWLGYAGFYASGTVPGIAVGRLARRCCRTSRV